MDSPTLFGVYYNQISFNWTDVTLITQTGSDPIVYYEVRYKASAGDTYAALTTFTQGKFLYYDHKLATGTFPSNVVVYYILCA